LGCPLRRLALGHPSINDSKTAQNRTADVPILTHLGVKCQGVKGVKKGESGESGHMSGGSLGKKGRIWYFYEMRVQAVNGI
jgi:hypothetical protein